MTTLEEILDQLENASHPGTLKRYEKIKETKPYYGVPMGAISRIAKQYKEQTDLFRPLWQTDILEAQYLAIQLAKAKPNILSEEDIKACLQETVSLNVLDKFTSIILSKRKDRQAWEDYLFSKESPIFQRLAWFLRASYFASQSANREEIDEALAHIKANLQTVDTLVQWTMNHCLVEIALAYPDYLDYCLALGQELGVYADMKVAKGCTSAYAPDWIHALLAKRNK